MTLCNTLAREGGRSKRTPPRVPAVPHLLGHRTVDILGDIAGHQIDRDGANTVPAKSRVVLQTIARAVLGVGREQGGKKVSACGWSPAHLPPLNCTDTFGSEGYCHFPPHLSSDRFAADLPAVARATPVSIFLLASFPVWVSSLTTAAYEV